MRGVCYDAAMNELRVHLLPELVEPADLAGRTVVVIDVLRATTTICHALAAGAKAVMPCLEINEARAKAAAIGAGAVLGGERLGLRIDGFDLGNSPTEYTRETVGGRTVVFTTTNGTKAMLRAREAANLFLGAFVNVSAVVEAVAAHDRVDLVCAGTRDQVTAEDALFAGAVADRVGSGEWGVGSELNDQARLARDAWRSFVAAGVPLAATLRECQGGRNLIAEGFDADIDTAAVVDQFTIVPRFDFATRRIVR
jgi:2-phosphosulfolactate phosphatase